MKLHYQFYPHHEDLELWKKRQFLYRILPDFLQANGVNSSIEVMEVNFYIPNFAHKKESKIPADFLQELPRVRFTKNRTNVYIYKLFLGKNGDEQPTIDNILYEFGEIFRLLEQKKKASDYFDTEKTLQLLSELAQELKTKLDFYNEKAEQAIEKERIERAKQDREERLQTSAPHTRLIRDIRLYYAFENQELKQHNYFSPYNIQLCEKICERLRQKKFRLPSYDHLYIQVSESFDKALSHAIRAEKWLVYGVSVLENPLTYSSLPQKEKKQVVFHLIKQGLLDIAQIDRLDTSILNEVLDEIEKTLQ